MRCFSFPLRWVCERSSFGILPIFLFCWRALIFYYWGEKWRIMIFIATTFMDYLSALLIARGVFDSGFEQLAEDGNRARWQKIVLALSIFGNLSVLAYFKYFNFLVDGCSAAVTFFGLSRGVQTNVSQVILPLGISFFTFHSMSYTIDVYRGRIKATRNFIDYACYVLMFPQLVAGPIVRYASVGKALVERRVSVNLFASGVCRFAAGLGKKVLIANFAAMAADEIFALPAKDLSPSIAWFGLAAYTIQIYFDFSGYSDMAIGLARMLGFELPENFNFPYAARSLRDFWSRWHISLSSWFRDYLYIPLGGSRCSTFRTCFNLLLVFFSVRFMARSKMDLCRLGPVSWEFSDVGAGADPICGS